MRSTGRRPYSGSVVRFDTGLARVLNLRTIWIVLFAILSSGTFWLVGIYGDGLRDPRYLDGWILGAGMAVQLYFHIAIKTAKLTPKVMARWRGIHIFVGYLLIAAFLSHSNFSLPDTGFEWALWLGFMLVTLSGLFGAYLSWSLREKGTIDDRMRYADIPARRADLARDVHALVVAPSSTDGSALPAPPYDAWIMELYAAHLRNFFEGGQNISTHLTGSKRELQLLTDEIDKLSRYVDFEHQERLAAIRSLVLEKDRLDFARVHLALSRSWLFVHVPVTYSLVVLTALHVLVVYSFSSGSW